MERRHALTPYGQSGAVRASHWASTKMDGRSSGHDTGLAAATPATVVEHTMADEGVLTHKADNTPTFDLIVYTGYPGHFWHWLNTRA